MSDRQGEDGPPRPGAGSLAGYIAQAAGAALAALAAVVYTISFAVVVYGGALAPFVDRGIGLVLIGSALATAIVGIGASARGMIAHPQEAPLLLVVSATPGLLAAAAAAGAGPGTEAQFATFVAFLICSTVLTGLLMVAAGRLRLSFVARYLPFPVIGGVIASIGYLLIVSAASLVTRAGVDIYTLPATLAASPPAEWAPWAAGAAALFLARRRLAPVAVLPVAILAAFLAFHAGLRATGTSLAEAEAAGLLLGPFPEEGFLDGLGVGLLRQAEWGAVLSNLAVLGALAPVSALTAMIHVQAVCGVTGQEPDLDRDLVANGLANVAGGGAGGLVCFPAISTSLLAHQFATPTLLSCGATVALSLGVAVFGAELLGALPRGLLAMIVLYLGLDMLIGTLVREWRRLPARDLAPILAILATTVAVGLPQGLALGVALAMLLFVVSYARLPFVRADTTLALRRSIVERGAPELKALAEAGRGVRILEIGGYLFFGTAHALRERVRRLAATDPMEALVLDFRAVRDIDASAIASLESTQRELRDSGVAVHICGLPAFVADRLDRFGFGAGPDGGGADGAGSDGVGSDGAEANGAGAPLYREATLDEALERIEDGLLARAERQGGPAVPDTFLGELAAAVPGVDLAAIFDTLSLPAGAVLIEQGAQSSEIFVLLEGRAAAVLGADGADPLVVARFEPGALIGEMAFYQGAPRSATVVAERPSRFLRIERRRLEAGEGMPPALPAAFHRIAARHLSQRLDRATRLLRDAQP